MIEGSQGSDFVGMAVPRWAPDGTRFTFDSRDAAGKMRLLLANSSGGRAIIVASLGLISPRTHSWSPDSQWIAVVVLVSGKLQLVKIEPVASAIPISLTKAVLDDQVLGGPEWSPAGDWILYPSTEGMSLIFPDGASTRKLTSRKLMAYGFSRDGRQVYGVFQNTTGAGAQWQLYAIDVSSGVEKMLAPVDLPASTTAIAGFSMHPDGQRFLRTIVNSPYDIWMLEGFDQPRSKTWLERLLRR